MQKGAQRELRLKLKEAERLASRMIEPLTSYQWEEINETQI